MVYQLKRALALVCNRELAFVLQRQRHWSTLRKAKAIARGKVAMGREEQRIGRDSMAMREVWAEGRDGGQGKCEVGKRAKGRGRGKDKVDMEKERAGMGQI